MNPTKIPSTVSLFSTILLLVISTIKTEASDLFPSALMKHETQWLIKVLEQAHFNKVSIDELNSTSFINRFVSKLDKQKLYFTEAEIDEFHLKYSKTINLHFKQGNLLPGFEIYNKYKQKSIARLEWVLETIKEKPALFQNKIYSVDREDSQWKKSEEVLDNAWIDLINFDFTREIVQQIDSNVSSLALATEEKSLEKYISEARDNLSKSYSRWIKNIQEFEASDIQEIYLTTLTHMFDPHTVFLNVKEKEKFDQAMNNEFVGIGARLQDEDGLCTIKELLPGGPAEASRELEPEDVILKVAQSEGDYVDVVDMKLTKIVELIKGPKDTLVRLEIRPIKDPSSTKEVRIIRDKIKLTENLAKGYVKQVEVNGEKTNVGVIELPSFYGSSGGGPKATEDVEELIQKLKEHEVKGIILDLRRNGGGYLSEAVNLAGLFIVRGPVVQVKSTDGKIRKKFDFNPKISWNGPLLTLVSRYSASASEIVAGALQDHDRSITIGDEFTHGKGTVQSMVQMNLPFNLLSNQSSKKSSAAKITIQKYYLPSGKSTQIDGVKSDVSIPSINMFLPIGESDLDNALANDNIPPVNFRKSSDQFVFGSEKLDELSKKIKLRRENSEILGYLNNNIDYFNKKRNQKAFPMDLEKRIDMRYNENKKNQELKDNFESLSKYSFPTKDISLDIVTQQIDQSRKARGINTLGDDKTPEYTMPKELDISLNESIKVMKDYLELAMPAPSANKTEKRKAAEI